MNFDDVKIHYSKPTELITMLNHKNTLTIAAVYETAESLMATYGTTTTLEVKNRLRNQGFWAVQADVSALMWEIAQEAGWQVYSNGRFRVYAPAPGYRAFCQPQDTPVGRVWVN